MSSEKLPIPDRTQKEQGGAKPVASVAAIKPRLPSNNEETDIPREAKAEKDKWDDKYKDDEDDKPPAYETVKTEKHHAKPYAGRWAIKKDDVFFHFITVCFALGIVLVAEHNYSDWTVSAGAGLISFAVLEAIGIYFNFVNRVRSIARAIIRVVMSWADKFPLSLKNR
ncbi:transmembrane protein 40 isoform X3 [Pyxicephalus adspersus]|uniref:transmembrane protein 40 isoform X3 n=1 Tax=Pyxicephalus adspersus TaxID=30357 RepID=UPI003B59BCED